MVDASNLSGVALRRLIGNILPLRSPSDVGSGDEETRVSSTGNAQVDVVDYHGSFSFVTALAGGIILSFDRDRITPEIYAHDISVVLDGVEVSRQDLRFREEGSLQVRYQAQQSKQITLGVSVYGRKVFEHTFFFGGVRGSIDAVKDGKILGWVSVLDGADVDVFLQINDHDPLPVRPNFVREDMAFISGDHSDYGFGVTIPSDLSGLERYEARLLVGDTAVCAPFVWESSIRFNVDGIIDDRVHGWCFESHAPNRPLQLTLMGPRGPIDTQTTYPRIDVKGALGASQAGFDLGPLKHGLTYSIVLSNRPERALLDGFRVSNTADRVQRAYKLSYHLMSALDGFEQDTELRQEAQRFIDRVLGQARTDEVDLKMVSGRAGASLAGKKTPPVDIVIPIYAGFEEVKRCLDTAQATLRPDDRIIAVYDAGPEPEIEKYLRDMVQSDQLLIMFNEENLGFPRTVNRGLDVSRPDADIICLNADTAVPPRWIERLQAKATQFDRVASVTPMSNNATIMSFPRCNFENALAHDEKFLEYDKAFEARGASSEPIHLPTAVGFCMYMTRASINEIGGFSDEYGRGYFEEVDWSLRAKEKGFLNIAATDLFVEHEGSVSFGKDTREQLVADNAGILSAKFPEYIQSVSNFVRQDPLAMFRSKVYEDILLAEETSLCFHVYHGMGGGTLEYIKSFSDQKEGCTDLLIEPYMKNGDFDSCVQKTYRVHDLRSKAELFLDYSELVDFLTKVCGAKECSFVLHSTIVWRPDHLDTVLRLLNESADERMAVLHDYSAFCPRVQMLGADNRFCALPEVAECENCIQRSGSVPGIEPSRLDQGVKEYRQQHHDILKMFDEIVVPNPSSKPFFEKCFSDVAIDVRRHKEDFTSTSLRAVLPNTRPLRLGFIGAIGKHKGYDVVCSMAREVVKRNLPVEFNVVGYTCNDQNLLSLNQDICIHGRYERDEVEQLLDKYRVDVIMIPSIWPETHCYAVSDAWRAGRHVIAFDIGAQAERIRTTNGGQLLPLNTAWRDVPDAILKMVDEGAFAERTIDVV